VKRKGGKRTAPVPAGGDGMGDCGLYRCAKCGGTFAVMPAVLTNGSTRVTAPLGDDGDPVPVRPYALIGGRKWCAECAENRYPRREQAYMDLEEWRRTPRRGAHGRTFDRENRERREKGRMDFHAVHDFHGPLLGGCTACAESAHSENEETDGQERLPPRRGRDGARLQARAESAGAAAPERRATASAGAPSCGSLRAGGAKPVGNRTAEGAPPALRSARPSEGVLGTSTLGPLPRR
jgi:hypothetical protein